MRIGILGGAFDPIHLGHLLLAEKAREKLSLAKVIFIPCFISPFKKEIVSSSQRYKMVCLAISDNPFFVVSKLEIKRKGVSYSIDTVRELKKRYPRDEFFFILGSDSWGQFSSWKDSDELLKLIRFAVMERKGFSLRENGSILRISGEVLPISSSQIRERVKQNKSIRYLVPERVRRYILRKGLYK
ncbi:MAG: nicotinate-nucleotide adenylyltransferase [Candidatus Omnitrophica bacterium]|nr:nicotinate-nucleotide adenylyltransferase [Candidatus Omnitrophota bacterium]